MRKMQALSVLAWMIPRWSILYDEFDFSDLDVITPSVSTSSLALDDVRPESTGLCKLTLDDAETTDAPSETVPCTQHAGFHSRDAPRGTFRTVRTWWRS